MDGVGVRRWGHEVHQRRGVGEVTTQFTKFEEQFGSKQQPYSNSGTTDATCILRRVQECRPQGNERHVFFVGESHNNRYDIDRRRWLILTVRKDDSFREYFPDGNLPKIIAERFPDVQLSHVCRKEPNLADDIPEAFRKLHKAGESDPNKAAGVITKAERLCTISGSNNQSRNQWLAWAIMMTIQKTWEKRVAIIVVCGDEHERFVTDALKDLVKQGYQSTVEVVWHHFPSAPDTGTTKDESLTEFKFSLDGKTPVGFILGKNGDSSLIKLAEGIIKTQFTLKLECASALGNREEGWAVFLDDDQKATPIRSQVSAEGKMMYTLTPAEPVRVLKIDKNKIDEDWPDLLA
jgi:hypothetical protein